MSSSAEIDRVWTMPESSVYHVSPDCRALKRANRYWSPTPTTLAEATSTRRYSGQRRPCALCASGEAVEVGTATALRDDRAGERANTITKEQR